MTPFSERVRLSLRETLLDAAAELLAQHGFAGLRMVDVATSAGVSRQTVYNEFGSKAALVDAVVLRTLSEFLDGTEALWRATTAVADSLRATVEYTVRHGRENRLVAAVLGGAQAEDLLPLLTTRAEPVFRHSIDQVSHHLTERIPALPPERAALLAESIVRLSISHMLLPGGTPGEAADAVCSVVLPAIEAHS
ncbi:TetR family transcriptional regulator [Actinosynnema sp. ALI-1.44]|nr:TetR family transcriptional regulator [Actinosynnema sp. ALI-1.44]